MTEKLTFGSMYHISKNKSNLGYICGFTPLAYIINLVQDQNLVSM